MTTWEIQSDCSAYSFMWKRKDRKFKSYKIKFLKREKSSKKQYVTKV
jgi:hypothetical protein